MKKTILAMILGLAVMPLTFAQAPAPSAPADAKKTEKPAVVKKHKKHHKKNVKSTTAPAATPAAPQK